MTVSAQYTAVVCNSYLTIVRDDGPAPFPSQVYGGDVLSVLTSKAASLGVDRTQLVRAVEKAARDRGLSVPVLLTTVMGWL